MVVARDVLNDRKRTIIFDRARNNCQTIWKKHPYLELTGPTRVVVTCYDPGDIEVMLKLKGADESEDRDLSFLALTLKCRGYCSFDEAYTSKRSTLELTFRHIESCVEAMICVRLVGGSSWPEDLQGVLTASIASIDDAEGVLLAFGDDKLPVVVADDGTIKLSRRVVAVELDKGELKVSVVARRRLENGEHVDRRDDVVFTSMYAGRSCDVLDVGSCKLQVTVAWSLIDD
ncbi:uncharacterized protein LOC112270544 [Brachypodium distachyon]|uniref:DUF6598 domain-containing protein n=1 Tax=Brachypodium distachyon TaxID=15368 RepID=A0A0Q3IA83_BRADI|nr:uncharacterized protein LOC112270544 [Brachypodium distachyon]KQK02739.1 hypothetical protein BRADI_2g03376v3 [Brachypodium distachyon]|eukprot:XP_024313955.1 uncharacterized protein LOC112270544 [Brachypodium distachyon]